MSSLFPGSVNPVASPFLKWVGGKRQLVPELRRRFPQDKEVSSYIEPFVGGGGMLLSIQPQGAVISDSNTELMNVYRVVRDAPAELVKLLECHENTPEHYYEVREQDRTEAYSTMPDLEKAARFIFLNKTCFNGLFRVNAQGFFNVPYGYYKKPQYVEYSKLMAVSAYLNHSKVKIEEGDYSNTLKHAAKGAFFYLDPPYAPISETSNFTGYTPGGFPMGEQVRLREFCREVHARGGLFMLSNSNSPLIHELYGEFTIQTVSAQRNIAAHAERRGVVQEVVVTNY